MSLEAGYVYELTIAREVSPYGYFVTDGAEEVLLAYAETDKVKGKKPGEKLQVFLFYDTEDRLAATQKTPLIRMGEVALLEVVEIHPRFGTFLDMGLGRHLLLPFKEQPEFKDLRPVPGDKVFVTLAHDRQGRLIAKLAGEDELAPLTFHAPSAWMNQWLDVRVYKALQMGSFAVVDGGVLGFGVIGMIHASERTHPLRVGETAKARVVYIREDGRVNLSMRQSKHVGREEDADKILAFLRSRPQFSMPYSDSTSADVVLAKFGMSKGAFKRALGKLMKEGLISQKENWTYLQESAAGSASEPADDGQA
ncbi:S1 RNA-binding domain-containing protein [Gorillibacterium massiliense]|uniref:CvfB family protein n=1 Tax=Gorillibacterium massiliense TaxID=1280390 RepID=UPI0004B30572|nr:S1-like domain-containing RNA-binding protein [Gorillibacterium massiliense]